MDTEDFELAVTAVILVRRIRKRRFNRKPRKPWIRAIFKEREEKGAYYQLTNEILHQFFVTVNSDHFCKKWLLRCVVFIYVLCLVFIYVSISLSLYIKNGCSNKKQTKLYKFNRRSKTMVGIPLN